MDLSGGYSDSGFVADIYDHVPIYKKRTDVKFYQDYARQSSGEILELGCGTGRTLIPCAETGAKITGIDMSDSMLAVCRANIAQLPEEIRARIEILKMDMRAINFERQFDLVTVPFRAFLHLNTAEDQKRCLTGICDHLKAGGRFILDIFNPSLHYLTSRLGQEIGDEEEFEMPGYPKIKRRYQLNSVDYFNQTLDTEMTYYVTRSDGKSERLVHSFRLRYIYRFEAEYLLNKCGFKIEDIFGNYERSPYGETAYPGELIIVARKA